MDRPTGRRDVTEMLLKKLFNNLQPINLLQKYYSGQPAPPVHADLSINLSVIGRFSECQVCQMTLPIIL